MKILRLLPFLSVFLLSAIGPNPGSPSGLMVEFIRQPATVPILDLKPEFSWIVPVGEGSQTAFRIVVLSAVEGGKTEKVIWDSGRIVTSNSTEVEYGGTPLSPDTGYKWKVMIWDGNDRSSPFSQFQDFHTGDPKGYTTTRNRFIETLISPSVFYVSGEESYFADFGKDAFGTLVLDLDFVTNDTILVRLGEKLVVGGVNGGNSCCLFCCF